MKLFSRIFSRCLRHPLYCALLVSLLGASNLFAIHYDESSGLPYAQKMEHPLDQPVNERYNNEAFFMNLGPTGIRAVIEPDEPKAFKVKFVFQDDKSPAKGLINAGDMIIGANGKVFNKAHGFHRKRPESRGWQGPPFGLAQAIEDSQGNDGKLELIVMRDGDKEEITVQLEPVGRFSPTYPWDCPRSDALRQRLVDFMLDQGITGREHKQIQQLLALWASGDKRAIPLVKEKGKQLSGKIRSHTENGMVTWGWGYQGIFLGEYYNMTKDKGVMKAVEALVEAYELGQDWSNGGFSHRPYPFIQQRVAGGGPKGYGAMAGPGGLSMLAQSVFKQTGLPYSERAYNRTHQSFLRTAGARSNASIAYGFTPWYHATIKLVDNTLARSERGIGYRVPGGMEGIGEYAIAWPTKADPRWKPTDWVEKEKETNQVFEQDDYRVVVREMILPEPERAYDTAPGGGGHVAPMGMGAVAHFIGNKGNESWNWLGQHLAAGCAKSPGMLFDGHADAVMHAFFSVIGAARAEEEDFRDYLDYVKTLIVLSEPHDGQGLVEQPFGCQRNSTCSISRDRRQYTHVILMLLSIPKRQLLITGADVAQPAPDAQVEAKTTSAFGFTRRPAPPPVRKARVLADGSQSILDRALLKTLVRLADMDKLGPIPMAMSFTRAKIWLKDANEDGQLTFQLLEGNQTAALVWDQLTPADSATLALLVANLQPESGDAQALAAVYLELLGKVVQADKYFSKAGSDSRKKLETLFE